MKNTIGDISKKIKEALEKEDNEPITDDDVWTVFKSFVDENGFNSVQIHSFNEFICNGIQKIVDTQKYVVINVDKMPGKVYQIEFGDVYLTSPSVVESDGTKRVLYETEALWRNINYAAELYIDITITPPDCEPSFHEKQFFGYIPIMKHSCLCTSVAYKNDPEKLISLSEDVYDNGGYFTLAPKNDSVPDATAQRKILVAQEKTTHNFEFVFHHRKTKPKYSTYVELRSMNTSFHTTTSVVGLIGNIITTILPWIDSTDIPIGIVFYALGVESEKDILTLILGPDFAKDREALELLTPSLEYSYECADKETALQYIGKKGRKFIKREEEFEILDLDVPDWTESEDRVKEDATTYSLHLLSSEFLPHVGQGIESFPDKARYFAYMIQKLIMCYLGRRKIESRDHIMNKRIMTTGALLTQQFHAAFRRLIMEITNNVKKALTKGNTVNILSWIRSTIITNALHGAISANNWSCNTSAGAKGIAQSYEQFNHTAGIANLRKVNVPIGAEGGKVIEPRDNHGSNFGVICPAETPEGKRCGLVKNFALSSYVTIGSDPTPIKKIVDSIVGKKYKTEFPRSLLWTRIFINGVIVSYTEYPYDVVNKIRELRRSASISVEVSIAFCSTNNEIRISTEPGRICRPLFIMTDGKLVIDMTHIQSLYVGDITWTQLLASGTVELIDKAEEEFFNILFVPSDIQKLGLHEAMKYSHCELHPSLMFGIGGSLIPFPNHNQSPRNCYQSAMGKQSVGDPFTNYREIMSGSFHTLHHLQKPLVLSRAGLTMEYDIMPSGQNAMVVIMPRENNEEDSLEINKTSVEMGFMRSYKWTLNYLDAKEEEGEKFGIPSAETCDRFRGNPSLLTAEGFVKPGTKVNNGDIIIGKMIANPESSSLSADGKKKPFTNASIVYDHIWPATVDKVQIGTNGDGYPYIRVMLVQPRDPVNGDKFSARHGQKGTIGMIVPAIDLPFNRQGITPDIVVNPLAFPSRMTIAMLIELLGGKTISSTSPLHKVTIDKLFGEDNTPGQEYNGELSEKFEKMFMKYKDTSLMDGTPFVNYDFINVINEEIKRYGFEYGDEIMTDGVTGRPLRALMFYGPVYYQRLKHQVIDKIHARAKGGKTTLMRQPKEGRAQGGGFRIGVMERDCILGQGAPKLIRDRLMEQSDEFHMWICDICGLQAHTEKKGQIKECRVCGTNKVSKIKIPYGTKLINQEFMAMNMVPRIMTSPLNG